MDPLYTPQNTEPAYQLNWGLTIFWRHRPIPEERWLSELSRMIDRVASKHGDRLSRVGMFPDHTHITIGCAIDRSPEEVALSYLNNCAYACGMKPLFQFGYYVGTIGEYDRGAV